MAIAWTPDALAHYCRSGLDSFHSSHSDNIGIESVVIDASQMKRKRVENALLGYSADFMLRLSAAASSYRGEIRLAILQFLIMLASVRGSYKQI